jgi:serine/threonine protein kinase
MELCEGGELLERIIAKEYFNEEEAKGVFRQIISGLDYCHSNNICHRYKQSKNFIDEFFLLILIE